MFTQRNLRYLRIFLAWFFMLAVLLLLLDVRSHWMTATGRFALKWQFVPAALRLITPLTLFSGAAIILLILTLLLGRVYCSTICPLGILQDVIRYFKRKLGFVRRERYKKPLNYIRYSILTIVVLSFLFSGIWLLNILDPYAGFGRIVNNLVYPLLTWGQNHLSKFLMEYHIFWLYPKTPIEVHTVSLIFALSTFTLVAGFVLWRGRLYCNTICPVGAFLGLVSKFSIFKLKINSSTCTQCGKCMHTCKANCIDVKTMKIDESRCVNCYDCIPVCDDSSISYQFSYIKQSHRKSEFSSADASKRQFLGATILGVAAMALPQKLLAQHGKGHSSHDEHSEHENEGSGMHVCFWEKGTVCPPGSVSVAHLKSRCIACHACISACPTKVLTPTYLEYGFTGMMMPKLDYRLDFCDYECTVCGEVCPTGAILPLSVEQKKKTQIGVVQFRKGSCIVHTDGTSCGSCSEHCPTQAVEMVPYVGDLTIPRVHPDICIGCGACEYACPVTDPHKAIFVAANNVHLEAELPKSKKMEVEQTDEFPF